MVREDMTKSFKELQYDLYITCNRFAVLGDAAALYSHDLLDAYGCSLDEYEAIEPAAYKALYDLEDSIKEVCLENERLKNELEAKQ